MIAKTQEIFPTGESMSRRSMIGAKSRNGEKSKSFGSTLNELYLYPASARRPIESPSEIGKVSPNRSLIIGERKIQQSLAQESKQSEYMKNVLPDSKGIIPSGAQSRESATTTSLRESKATAGTVPMKSVGLRSNSKKFKVPESNGNHQRKSEFSIKDEIKGIIENKQLPEIHKRAEGAGSNPIRENDRYHQKQSGATRIQIPGSGNVEGKGKGGLIIQQESSSTQGKFIGTSTVIPIPEYKISSIHADWSRFAIFEQFQTPTEKGLPIPRLGGQVQIKGEDNKKNAKPDHSILFDTLKMAANKGTPLNKNNPTANHSSGVATEINPRVIPLQLPGLEHNKPAQGAENNVDNEAGSQNLNSMETTTAQPSGRSRSISHIENEISSSKSESSNQDDSIEKAAQINTVGVKNVNSAVVNASLPELIEPKSGLMKIIPGEVSRVIIEQATGNQVLGGKVFGIKLHPPELGFINLRLTECHNAINIKITVESELVYKAIQNGSDDIRNILFASGIKVDQMEVKIDERFHGNEYHESADNRNGFNPRYDQSPTEPSEPRSASGKEAALIIGDQTSSDKLFVSSYGINWLA